MSEDTAVSYQGAVLGTPVLTSGPPVYRVDALQYSGRELRDCLGRLFGRPHWTREHN
jgi:hypothetical protein